MSTQSPAAAALRQRSAVRQCPFCGKALPKALTVCPYCRQTLPEVQVAEKPVPAVRRGQIRRGLIYMLLAAVIHYFAGGYSSFNLPFPVNPVVTVYLSPALFLGGLALTLYAFFRK